MVMDSGTERAMRVRAQAEEARAWFEYRRRRGGAEAIYAMKDGAPRWVGDLVQEAHRHGRELMSSDDYRYAYLVEALDHLAKGRDPDDYAPEVDVFMDDLVAWLGSHAHRRVFVDAAMELELVPPDAGICTRIASGQEYERREVLALALRFLRDRAEVEVGDARRRL
jgi:hypothetical protein